ncbi:TIGR02452 family protein [Paenibacillus sinopodophylli]|uniref:TIGR02452 family protein n=1 Tax=Paenibacillus sinopodophylli TaxID=1837342 RepID=UPI00110CEB34|nr:TIGR02452 family protein [Paenibacillus sinopodophylli]
MNRKQTAEESLCIMRQGFYEHKGRKIDFAQAQKASEENSVLVTPEQGREMVKACISKPAAPFAKITLANMATIKAILQLDEANKTNIGVLNFASAKNPGGGFLNGAMAQEESLAASSGLYATQLCHEHYYLTNRALSSMMYTDFAIYSPDVVFFRDERFSLLEQPVTASVLTLPAVNYGQVLLKGEDSKEAKRVMKDRMRIALAILAAKGDKSIILGAYGCGVFRNDPVEVAKWWKELLFIERYGTLFDEIMFAVLDTSKEQNSIRAFENVKLS